jgi:hypothetical protein
MLLAKKRPYRSVLVLLGVMCGMFFASMFAIASPQPAHATVWGTVDCVNKQVLGVWVEAQDSTKRGWASITPIEGNYRYSWSHSKINVGDVYQLHVGCGDWSPSAKTSMAAHPYGDFLCKRNWGLGEPTDRCYAS